MKKFRYSTQPLAAAIIVALSLGITGTAMAASGKPASAVKGDTSAAPQTTTPEATINKTKAERAKEKKRVAQLSAVVVNGYAGSQQRDVQLKRYSPQTQDSITASNIGQLPAADIADALQHVAGVQVARSAGQGTTVAIRGIAQVKTTINGEEYFNAGGPKSRPINPWITSAAYTAK